MFKLQHVDVNISGKPILRDIDCAIREGEWTAVAGPSGSGKTTLLKLLCFMVRPSAGSVEFRGSPVAPPALTAIRRRAPLTLQEPVLPARTVRENLTLAYGFQSARGEQPPADQELAACLACAELDPGMLDQEVQGLSGGEKQRVAIARALCLRPEALLLDEPTSALDTVTAGRIFDNLRRERPGLTVVMATHSEALIERTEAQVLLGQGRVSSVERGLSPGRLKAFLEEAR
jgi:ABC-type bacteriocin/lantibiotic exporter with double-glycine peptidase domain